MTEDRDDLAPEAEGEDLKKLEEMDLESAGKQALEELEDFQTTEEALEAAKGTGEPLEALEDSEGVMMVDEDDPVNTHPDSENALEAAFKLLRESGYHVSEEPQEREDLEPEEAVELSRDEKKRRIAQVLTRGRVNSKVQAILDRYVPEGRVGKLIRDTPEDIAAHENLGFTFVEGEGLHGTGDGRVRVGDTVLVSISIEDQEILREIRGERVLQNVGGAAEQEFMKNSELGYNESETRIGGK